MRLFIPKGASGRPQHILLALALATAGFLLAGTAQAQSLLGTSHDLSATSNEGQTGATLGAGTGEICAYCHTPHGGDTSAPAPLWNRNLASVNGFDGTRYSDLNTTTLQGEEAQVGSISLACLSCHDGVQAMDTVINAPGRGPGNTSGNNAVMTGADNTLAVIGTDLRDDHPVSIQFCGGGIDSADGVTGAISAAANCAHGDDYNDPQTDTINGNQVWWLDTTGTAGDGTAAGGVDATRERTDIFLYSRNDFVGNANVQPSVECGSCHDPHVDSPNTANEVNFMRISNEASNVCLTCHNK